jgi:hypothetical protein
MSLPFTLEQFLDVFRAYNGAIWPAQLLLYGFGVALVLVAVRAPIGWGGRAVAAGLALLWAWTGAVYHLGFFAGINPAARLFGVAFLGQAILWVAWAWRTPELGFRPSVPVQRLVGAGILGYAFVVYPLLNVLLGHRYPAMPTFGAPCPTTIATFGLLTWATPRPPWFVWPIPVLWALVGTSAAFALGVREDLGLLAAAGLAVAVQLRRRGERLDR